ncbi:RNA methyltransferase [Persicimonas caeni]|uniref:tRNA (guanosine(18)-2'-O)-methyltransferase n=1 Tax=Persicimonas caeni TaxID=2292766 RepID=A0A4Y6PY16_PERCE|nr:RNA methyltransferase [Persicimonas caeni]QDG53212.1 RNA methyltransferase [Persicimonas caeni]QED34434.1 RNA methyltransferase [Persicimonas caeni]
MTDPLNPRFPHDETITIGEHELSADEVIELLAPRLTERRMQRIDEVIAKRTCEIACVFDGPYDMGNVSAVLRTCEGLGIQPVHLIETQEKFKEANRVTQGAEKWLDIRRWKDPKECVADLKRRGYRICATHLEASRPIAEIDFSEPTALVMGNEQDGVSQEVLEASDLRCIIPMAGFTQSYNISVAAALTLYHVRRWRIDRLGREGELSEREQKLLRAHFFLRGIDRGRDYLAELLARAT